MARELYEPRQEYLGEGNKSDYTFDFRISDLSHLLIIQMASDGSETFRVRGDDTTYLSSVAFDPSVDGGTVNLVANLPTDSYLIILQANDEPTQPSEFKNKLDFTLSRIENALDFLAGQVQRLAYSANRSLRIDDKVLFSDMLLINSLIPALENGAILCVNADGTGFEWGPTVAEIASNVAAAEEAQAAAEAAESSATSALASATAAAASATASSSAASSSAASASASAAAAAASAAAGGGIVTVGTRAAPTTVATGGTIPIIAANNKIYVKGAAASAATNVSIADGLFDGQELILVTCDDTASVAIPHGNNTKQNGDYLGVADSIIRYSWDLADWVEIARSY